MEGSQERKEAWMDISTGDEDLSGEEERRRM
jgi:hypothetical protein